MELLSRHRHDNLPHDFAMTGTAPPSGAASGDLAGTYPGPTLAVIVAAAGPIGSATVAPVVTIDAKGRVTVLGSATIVPTNPAGGDLTGNYPNPTIAPAVVTQAKMASEAATAWTPTLTGTGWALGNGTAIGRYLKYGRLVHADATITFGSTSTFGTAQPSVGGLPVALNADTRSHGQVVMQTAAGNTEHYGTWQLAVSATSGPVVYNAVFATPGDVFASAVSSTAPITFASGSVITLHLEYIAAS